MVRLVLRLEFPNRFGLGRGKIELLEQIRASGSISAAGRAMGMSYRRAWLLVDSMNQAFPQGVVETAQGGEHGGGARLTDFGNRLIDRFRRMEVLAGRALERELGALGAAQSVATAAKRPVRAKKKPPGDRAR
jgi:molybdate transport system regulatory protein